MQQYNVHMYLCVVLGTIPILRQQSDWLGGVRKMANFADVGWLGASEKVQKCADVIQGWSLSP